MERETTLAMYQSGEITLEVALDELVKIGYCPALLHDDNGHWAFTFGGYQNVPLEDIPGDIQSSFFVEAKEWKDTIRDAFIYAMTDHDDEKDTGTMDEAKET